MEDTSYLGKANYGSNFQRPNKANANWKVAQGDNVYRILPPFGLLAANGRWFYYDAIHWGYLGSNGKARPFRCIEKKNRKTKMIEVECPECAKIREIQNTYQNRKLQLEKEGKSQDDIKNILKPLSAWTFSHNNSKGFYVNALRPDGQIGRLFLKIRARQALDVLINDLREKEGVTDPCGIENGVWFNFTRSGERTQTVYNVKPVEELVEVNGRKLKSLKTHTLTEDVIKRMKTEAFELSTGYKDLSYDEIRRLVDSGGDPSIVDSIFGAPKVTNSETTFNEDDVPPDDDVVDLEAMPSKPAVTVTDDEEAKLLAQLERLRANKTHVVPPTANTATGATFNAGGELSTEEFRRIFGGK